MKFDKSHFIEELRFCIKTKDSIKLNVLMQYIDLLDRQALKRMLFELSRADDEFALPVIVKICRDHPNIPDTIPEISAVLLQKIPHHLSELASLYKDEQITFSTLLTELAEEI